MSRRVETRYHVRLKPGREEPVLRLRHPWVFSGAVERVEARSGAQPGDLGLVLTARGEVVGIGTVDPQAGITVRMLTFSEEPIDAGWFERRMAAARKLREGFLPPHTNCYRLINSEGDGLPGLIVDRYADGAVVQVLTSGMERLRHAWLPSLVRIWDLQWVLEKPPVRPLEHPGRMVSRFLHGPGFQGPVEVEESGARFLVDPLSDQKTGFFLDQRPNRLLVRSLSRGLSVLDGYAYTGGFAINAGLGGAKEVVLVESSPRALERARENWALNGLPDGVLHAERASVPQLLRDCSQSFDLIVIDPPPFARRRSEISRAARAYKDVNMWALRRLRPGGLLFTFTCSERISPELFRKIIFSAALDARVELAVLDVLGPGADHPVSIYHPEGSYLHGLLVRRTYGA